MYEIKKNTIFVVQNRKVYIVSKHLLFIKSFIVVDLNT